MGMKIRQESRVKTFFKKIFKISKRRNKDGSWKQLDKEALYALSKESGLDDINTKSGSTQNINNLPKTVTMRSDQDLSVEEVTVGDILEQTPEIIQHTDKEEKGNVSQRKGLKNVGKYEKIPDDEVNINTIKSRKAKRNSKNKSNVKNVSSPRPSQEQELLDIDLDLVLSSFPSIRQPGRVKTTTSASEADDNLANENNIRQGAPRSPNSREVKVIVETSPGITPRHQALTTDDNSQVAAIGNRYVEAGDSGSISACDVNNSARASKSDSDSEHVGAVEKTESRPTEAIESESLKDTIDIFADSQNKKTNRKKKTKKQRRSKRQKSQTYDESTLSTEALLTDEGVTPITPSQDKPQHTKSIHKYTVLDSVEEKDGDNRTTTEPNKKRNKRKNKKKGNVRRPEDDLQDDLRENTPRRPKHQVMWDPDEIVQETTEVDEPPATSKKSKKNRRRRLKFKINRDKKRLNVKRYDELCDKEDSKDSKTDNAKEVGRRMWRACKSGWKYLRNGLTFYARSPAATVSFGPLVKRYDDEFGEGRGPFSLA